MNEKLSVILVAYELQGVFHSRLYLDACTFTSNNHHLIVIFKNIIWDMISVAVFCFSQFFEKIFYSSADHAPFN